MLFRRVVFFSSNARTTTLVTSWSNCYTVIPMKPKQLKHPFSFDARRVMIDDGIFFVPPYCKDYQEFSFPGWPALFGNDHPVQVEYCSGNGLWITERAIAHPEINWVAVEIRFDRVRKLWSKKKNFNLDNLFIVCGEGVSVSREYFPSSSIQEVYVNFPDPWPKDRHAKHRIVQQPFALEVRRILACGGGATLVTDDPVYSQQMIREMLSEGRFRSDYPDPYYLTERKGYGSSYFEALWRSKGRSIHFHRFIPALQE
jgi:tRNA (guanine-N7-)-methyltransferase